MNPTDKKIQAPVRTKTRACKTKTPSIASILREAYRLHTHDRETRRAVKACLRAA